MAEGTLGGFLGGLFEGTMDEFDQENTRQREQKEAEILANKARLESIITSMQSDPSTPYRRRDMLMAMNDLHALNQGPVKRAGTLKWDSPEISYFEKLLSGDMPKDEFLRIGNDWANLPKVGGKPPTGQRVGGNQYASQLHQMWDTDGDGEVSEEEEAAGRATQDPLEAAGRGALPEAPPSQKRILPEDMPEFATAPPASTAAGQALADQAAEGQQLVDLARLSGQGRQGGRISYDQLLSGVDNVPRPTESGPLRSQAEIGYEQAQQNQQDAAVAIMSLRDTAEQAQLTRDLITTPETLALGRTVQELVEQGHDPDDAMAIAGVPRRPNMGADPLHFWRTPEGDRVTLIQTRDGWTNMDGTPVNPDDRGWRYEISASDRSDQTIAEMQTEAARLRTDATRDAPTSSVAVITDPNGITRAIQVSSVRGRPDAWFYTDTGEPVPPRVLERGNLRSPGSAEGTPASQQLADNIDDTVNALEGAWNRVQTTSLGFDSLSREMESGQIPGSIAGFNEFLQAQFSPGQDNNGNLIPGTLRSFINSYPPEYQRILTEANEALGPDGQLDWDAPITNQSMRRLQQMARTTTSQLRRSQAEQSGRNPIIDVNPLAADPSSYSPAFLADMTARRWNANNPPEMAEFIQAAEASPEGTQLFDVISSIRLLLGEAPEVVRAAMASQVSPGDTVSTERLRSVDPENLSLPELHMILSSGQEFPNWATFAAAIQGL